RRPTAAHEASRGDLDIDDAPILHAVPQPEREPRCACPAVQMLLVGRDLRGRPEITQGHPQEVVAGKAVKLDRRLVDRQYGERLVVPYPHGQGTRLELPAVALLVEAQRLLGFLALHELPDLAADGAHDLQQGLVGFADVTSVKFHDAQRLTYGENGKAE